MSDKILLTGATGTVGSFLLEQLLASASNFRALVRTAEKAAPLRARGVEVVIGDLDQPETLAPALEGIGKVFLLTAPDERQVETQTRLIEPARRAGVRHIVKLSAIGAAPDAPTLIHDHYLIEQAIEESGIPFTHLRPNGFHQNSLMFRQSVREQGLFYGPLGSARVSYVDARDVASVAARVLTAEGHEGKIYDITGPQALSYDEMARDLSAVLGKEVRYVDVPMEAVRAGMLSSGIKAWLADALIGLFDYYKEGSAAHVADTVPSITGRAALSFKQFAQDYVEAFR